MLFTFKMKISNLLCKMSLFQSENKMFYFILFVGCKAALSACAGSFPFLGGGVENAGSGGLIIPDLYAKSDLTKLMQCFWAVKSHVVTSLHKIIGQNDLF